MPSFRTFPHSPLFLIALGRDPSEKYNIAKDHPEVLADIQNQIERHRKDLVPGEDQLVEQIKRNG